MSSEEQAGREAWERWGRRELFGPPEQVAAGIQAAVDELQRGSSPAVAVVAARIGAAQGIPPGEVRALGDEVAMLERIVADLARQRATADLTQAGLDELRSSYAARLERARQLLAPAAAPLTGSAAAGAGVMPRPPAPSLREFFADNSILILSIAGAFLLIVATLLFEIYGTTGFGDAVRFAGVLALNLIFGAAGWLTFSRPRLRVVGQTYLAIFALMAPLTIAAAWVFLDLQRQGISRDLALGLGGAGCAVLYAILATRLDSRGYAALSMLALPVAVYGLAAAAGAGEWIAPWLSLLVFLYVAVRHPPRSAPAPLQLFSRLAEPFVHGAAFLATAWSLGQATSDWQSESFASTRPSFQLTVTLALVGGAYAIYCFRSRRGAMAWTVWVAGAGAVLAAVEPLALGQRGYVVALVILSWLFALGARRMPSAGVCVFVRIGAAVQAAIPALLSASPDGLQAAALLAASGSTVYVAVDSGRPFWLLVSAGIFGVDWYWLAKTLLPPIPNATADTLIVTYSPLPLVYGAVALLSRSRRRRWAWPVYVAGGVAALGVAGAAAGQNDLTLAGRALLVYAAVAYVVAVIERWWPVAVASFGAAAIAVLMLLNAASAAVAWFPVTVAALAVIVYAGHPAWRGVSSEMTRAHRFSALGIAGLAAFGSFSPGDFYAKSSPSAISALVTVLAAAGLLFVDGRLHRRPVFEYAAAAVASVGAFWIARYLGIDNPQAAVALTGPVLIALGVIAPQDGRHPAPLWLSRVSVAAGASMVMGLSAYQSVAEDATATYTTLWVIEAVLCLVIGIGARSRTLVLAGGAGLGLGALRAIFLILQSVQVYVVFGVIAIILLVGAGVLAALRDRLAGARSSVSRSWGEWS